MDIWYTCSLRLSSLLLSVCVSVCMRALLHVYTRGLVHKCTFPWNCGVLWVLMPGVLCVFPVCLNVGCGSCGVSHNNVSVMCFICTCVFLCGIFVWLHVCTNICAFPCVCAPVFVCVCIYKGEVRGTTGDDMHVSGLLTSLTTRALTNCPPSQHDGRSGKPNAPFPLCLLKHFLVFPFCHYGFMSQMYFFVGKLSCL